MVKCCSCERELIEGKVKIMKIGNDVFCHYCDLHNKKTQRLEIEKKQKELEKQKKKEERDEKEKQKKLEMELKKKQKLEKIKNETYICHHCGLSTTKIYEHENNKYCWNHYLHVKSKKKEQKNSFDPKTATDEQKAMKMMNKYEKLDFILSDLDPKQEERRRNIIMEKSREFDEEYEEKNRPKNYPIDDVSNVILKKKPKDLQL